MIDRFSDKELIMLYCFILESLYLASRPEVGKASKCVLDRHSIRLVNLQEKPEDGKKIPSRRIVLENGFEKKTLTLSDLYFLKIEVEKRLFGAVRLERIEWVGGDTTIAVEEREDAVRLEVLSEESPAVFNLKDPQLLRLISTSLVTIQTWNAVYPVKGDRLSILPDKNVFAVFKLPEVEIPVGKYPYINLAVLCQRKMREVSVSVQ